jgi:aminoglycoside phosphotransferase (APT) family kinase protein
LEEACIASPVFRDLHNSPATINGTRHDSGRELVERLAKRSLRDLSPGFVTFVHGDLHPENILVRPAGFGFEFKFIDPKEWYIGDYIFDLGKLCHYLQYTGLAEKSTTPPRVLHSRGNIEFDDVSSKPAEHLVAEALRHTTAFAARHDDVRWRERFSLSMASNLLGIVAGRVQENKMESALYLYANGIAWLTRFLGSMEPSSNQPSPAS